MSSASGIRAGKAFVELFLDEAKALSGMKAFKARFQSWASSFQSIGQRIGAAGGMMFAPLALAVKSAADLNETMSAFGATFGDKTADVTTWMNEFSASVGRSKKETAEALTTFQSFYRGMGIGEEQATAYSKEMAALAVDFASFRNLQDPDAMRRFISAMSGSGEVLSMYGVNIMEAALNQKLLAMGFKTISQGATETEKVLARMAIIKESMGRQGALGDAVRTADSFSNQLKSANAVLQDMITTVGTQAMPVFRDLLLALTSGVKTVMYFVQQNRELVTTLAKSSVALIGVGAALCGIGKTMGVIIGVCKALGVMHALLMIPITPLGVIGMIGMLATLGAALYRVATSYGTVTRAAQELADTNNKQRGEDQNLFKRLQDIANSQQVTTTKMEEAAAIAKLLQTRYGDLGISINKATGEITGMAAAQEKLNKIQKAGRVADLKGQIAEKEKNIDVMFKKMQAQTGIWDWLTSSGADEFKRIGDIGKEMDIEKEKLDALKAELGLLSGGNGAAPVDLSPEAVAARQAAEAAGAGGKDGKPDTSAADQLDRDKEHASRLQDDYQRQLDRVQDLELDLKYAPKAGESDMMARARERSKELEKLEIDRLRAIRDEASAIGDDLINREFDLKKRMIDAQAVGNGPMATVNAIESKGVGSSTMGSFSAAVLGQLGSTVSPHEQKKLAALTDIAKSGRFDTGMEVGGDMEANA